MKYCLGALAVELHLDHSQSLKDRRSVMTSLKERVRNRFNVSVAELDFGEKWQRGGLVCSCAGTAPPVVEQTLRNLLEFIEQDPRFTVTVPQLRFYE